VLTLAPAKLADAALVVPIMRAGRLLGPALRELAAQIDAHT
jgi:hypothetical protein